MVHADTSPSKIVVRRGRKAKYDMCGFYEARFDPPIGHSDGSFAIRIYDDYPDTPYRQEHDHVGAYSVPGGWCPFALDFLWDEERRLFDAVKAMVAARKR